MSILRGASLLLAVVLVAAFAACGGGGGGDSSPAPAVAGSKIFVGDNGHGAIGSSPNNNPSVGTGVVDRVIQGGSTFLTNTSLGVKDFALDATNDRLFVSDSTRILAFDNVSTANGNVAARILANAGGTDTFSGIYLDTTNNRLYATVRKSPIGDEVRVYESASTATNATPSRTFSFLCDLVFDVAVDSSRNVAYVYFQSSGALHVAVFDSASTLTGAGLTPSRTIDLVPGNTPATTSSLGMFLDTTNNRLYVPNSVGGSIGGTVEVYNSPHAVQGSGMAARTIGLGFTANISYANIFVEVGSDRLYAADPTGVTIAQGASTLNGAISGVRILTPAGATFTAVAVKP